MAIPGSLGEQAFEIHRVEINVKDIGKPIYLFPFGDIHRYAPLCHKEQWLDFLDWAKNKPNAYFLGMGDYDDLMSFSERRAVTMANLHESTMSTIDDLFKKRTNDLLTEISFMKGKVIGLLEGNHFGVLTNGGMSTTQIMCDRLGCKYLGGNAYIRLSFKYGSKRAAIDIWAHHGRGASRGSGGSMNSVEQMIDTAEADIYLMGHDHKKSVAMKTRLVLSSGSNLEMSHKKILMARTGSFLRGYVPGEPSYIVKAAYSPTDLGVVKIEMTPRRKHLSNKGRISDFFYIDVHASI
jgi:hypothetical protein